ncbi:GNAT family N-acetyltransferase [Salirhabdus salicampi]|uniref:GNAT family N-acetyltransferase n=1 Tax=Salirhabdus salicampi TaxID=476102 RepID=UPI0020C33B34|nr:GNAT family N-acetyltransferase [Salirhabdus salicampi]MCP8616223.1 GNAT family N-acetyltransferase [Salirhabdus salicampi]
MGEISKITTEKMKDVVNIVSNAYPGFSVHSVEEKQRLEEKLQNIQENNEFVNLYGYYEENELRGNLRLHDFTINLFSKKMKAGGLGLVAVDLLHKKEKIAKQMVEYFLQYYYERQASIVMLYPFRPDFYKYMGFGFGTKMNQYKLIPSQFPNFRVKDHLVYLSSKDKEKYASCYQKYMENQHGMIERTPFEIDTLFKQGENRVIGYEKDGEIEGYAIFSFQKEKEGNFLINNIHIKEMVYLHTEALKELLTFFHSQADQINRIYLNTQDEYFHYNFFDARNGTNEIIPPIYHETNTSGVGIMYRMINTSKFFQQLSGVCFGPIDCKIKFSITDSFLSKNNGPVFVDFRNGYPYVIENQSDWEVEMTMDVSDFSSMAVGAVPFDKLYEYGLVKLSNEDYIEQLSSLFSGTQKPICMTAF